MTARKSTVTKGPKIAPEPVARGMTVEQMTMLDLGYAPPFSPTWDPVLVAARKATAKIRVTAGAPTPSAGPTRSR